MSATHSQPQRMCVGCRARKDQSVLSRYTLQPQGMVADGTIKASGRGWYVCSQECLSKLEKMKASKRKK